MRWILILISALFVTACGSANTDLASGDEPQLTLQAPPAINYNVLVRSGNNVAHTCDAAINNTFSSGPNYLKAAALSSTYKKSHSLGPQHYCLVTLSTSNTNAPADLANLQLGEHFLAFSKNFLYSLDGANSGSFDPTCDQIEAMDRDAGNMDQIDESEFDSATTAGSAYVYPGTGVNIAIVGTGTGNDPFSCNLSTGEFTGHDTHIESIISELAPSATIQDYIACGSDGICPSNEVGNQLLKIWKQNNPRQIVNLSLGGHDPDDTHRVIIGDIMRRHALVVASAGNGGSSVKEHYPASFASSVTNMLSVAAVGKDGKDLDWASFNTTGVANIAAPGINLCPASADKFRCGHNEIGISGTSFAAPYVAAIAANYMDRWNHWYPNNPNAYWSAEAYRNRMLNRALSVPGSPVKRAVYR